MTTTKAKLKVHSENLLPIIKKWLYSDKDIFVRELVSNSIDAIHKTKILRDQGATEATDEEFCIDVRIDKEAKTLTFSDTGIGMTADEVERYISQVAFSSAEEFMSNYKAEGDQMIGHFGLGFYSAYMIAGRVEIQTRSYRSDAAPVWWSCDGSTEYEIGEGTRTERGTKITLHVTEEEAEFLDEMTVRTVLNRYCRFLHHPIYLNDTRINEHEPLWVKKPSECTEKDYLDFYRALYPADSEPLFWIHLNVDYPFHLQGILYFPKERRRIDPDKKEIGLYCNRVFVDEGCKEILPEFLLNLHGVIDSPDIPLNVSRSALQMDRTVRQLSSHIAKKVADKLVSLHSSERDTFLESWPDVSVIVKLGAIQDPKFYERVKEVLVWKTSKEEWTTIEEYLERNADSKIYYTTEERSSGHFLKMYEEKGIEVLLADPYIDTYLINFLEGKVDGAKFQRIDGGVDDAILDKDKEKTLLDADGKSQAQGIADFFRHNLGEESVEVEAKSLASNALPGFICIDESSRRMRDSMAAMDPKMDTSAFIKRTFVVNTNHKLVEALPKLGAKNPELATALVGQLFQLSLLSQREMNPNKLNEFVSQSSEVLEKLTTALVEST